MALRHVLLAGGVPASMFAPPVAGNALAAADDLHRGCRISDLHLLADQLIWNAVIVPIQFHVIIYFHAGPLPCGILVAGLRQRHERRLLHRLEPGGSRSLEFFEWPVVELFQKFAYGLVELGEAEEGPVPKGRQYPALHHLHPGLHLGLVTGLPYARRDDGRPVMSRKLLVRRVKVGFIAAGPRNTAFEIIGDHYLGYAIEVLERIYVRGYPAPQALIPCGFGIGVIASPEHRDEDLRLLHFPGAPVDYRNGLACGVHKHFLPSLMLLAHGYVEL